jgi:hypothetical protein
MFGLDHRPAVYDVFPQSENPNFSGDGIAERSASSSHHESIDKDIQGMVIVRMNHGKAGGVAASCCAVFDMPHKKAYISQRIHSPWPRRIWEKRYWKRPTGRSFFMILMRSLIGGDS